jgi:ATP-dependent DNA helicase RecG
MATLSDRLDHVLGARVATRLAEGFDLHTVEDLLRHYPHRYAAKDRPLTEREPEEKAHITVIGRIKKTQLVPMKKRNGHFLKVVVATEGQDVQANFFNPHRLRNVLTPERRVMLSGTVNYYPPGSTSWSLAHPAYLVLPSSDDGIVGPVSGGGSLAALAKEGRRSGEGVDLSLFDLPYIPVYPASAEVQSWTFVNCLRQVLDQLDPVPEPLPERVRRDRGLLTMDAALRMVHFPRSEKEIEQSRARLRFDEAVGLQLVLATRRHEVAGRTAPACVPRLDGIAVEFDQRLPFELTGGQQAVAREISADLARPHPMNRLLQGEVGSGKTIVALRAMLQVVDAGYQCALLAPTEVLAAQHYRSLRMMLGDLATAGELGAAETATRVVALTGSMSAKARREALLAIVSGQAGIVIGTHALIQDSVEFFDLGMVVVDEQHRFGVEQRDALRNKAKPGTSPHVLVMTATPIPRTIAIGVLGDLETSTLVELPRGRSPIQTNVVPAKLKPSWVERAWRRVVEEVEKGRQAYVVVSRIGDEPPEKDAPQTTAAVDLYEQLRDGPLEGLRVGLLHGRLPADEKDAVMRAFGAGEIDVLVATTVVEVGVDVPNATVMVIVDADRFGVSQLHQLRGRVGRGGHPGLCVMISEANPAGAAMARLQAVAATTDGFELALLDLQQRREGDVLGAAQSGTVSNLKLLSLLEHLEDLTAAQEFARDMVERDPDLTDHPGLAALMTTAVSSDRVEYLAKS